MKTRGTAVFVRTTALALAIAGAAVAQESVRGERLQDPEAQPRSYLVVDLTDSVLKLAFGSSRLQKTERGVELEAPAAPGEAARSGRLSSGARELGHEANAVSVFWRAELPAGTYMEIEVSVSKDAVEWSRWYSVEPDPHSLGRIRERYGDGRPNPNYGFVAGTLLSWGMERYRFLRYRVTLASDVEASPSLHALRFLYQDTTLGGRGLRPQQKAGGYPEPAICNRTCWAARAPQCTIDQLSGIDRGVIHHTASQTDWDTMSEADSAANVRAHQNFHMDGNGWCDIGYHFLVDKLGNTFEGREGSISGMPRGAHDGTNENSIGVSLMGYLHSPYNQAPTQAMRDAAYDVISWKVEDPYDGYGSGPYGSLSGIGYTAGHRDVSATACPGDLMYGPYIGTNFSGGEARDEIHARITGGGGGVPCCPGPPTLRLVTGDGNGDSITVTWSDSGTVASYNVYTSSDGVTFGSPVAVASGTTTYVDTGVAAGEARFYKVTAVGSSQESAVSDVYGAVSDTSSSQVLIVDGNDRWNFQSGENPSGANHDFVTRVAAAMAGTTFDTVDNAEVESGAFALAPYGAVVWMLGEESTAQETFSPAEQSAVIAYLDAGGRLFVSGAEIGWDLVEMGSTADQAFYQGYLKAAYLADDAGTYDAESVAGGIFDGVGAMSFSGGPMDVGYPDAIDVVGGSQLALRYTVGGQPGAGISYGGGFRIVHMGFPFETINDPAVRSSVMDRALGYLFCTATESPEASCGDGVDNDCDGLVDGDDPDCQTCLPLGASCTGGADCCSNKCKGKVGSKTCK